MIQEFSSAYYQTSLNVEPYSDGPVIESSLYDFIKRNLYLDTTSPVMMRLGLDAGDRFVVEAESAVPRGVLALPESVIERCASDIVYMLKPERADQMGELYG